MCRGRRTGDGHPGVTSAISVPGPRRHPGDPPRGRPRVHRHLRAPAARTPRVAGRVGRRGTAARHRGAADGGAEPARDRRRLVERRPRRDTPVAVVADGSMPTERTVLSTLGDVAADARARRRAAARRSSSSATWSRSPTPTSLRALMAELVEVDRPGRPPARRLPRPARRRSCASTSRPSTGCSWPRARRSYAARSRPASSPLVPDGAALARRARRRARRDGRALLRRHARSWPSR